MTRTATFYVVLARQLRPLRHGRAKVVRTVREGYEPVLAAGQCAVKISIEVPDTAFEPLLQGPSLAFAVEDTLRAEVTKEKP